MQRLALLFVLLSLALPVYASGTDEQLAEIAAAEKARKENDARFAAEQAQKKRQEQALQAQADAQNAAMIRLTLGKATDGKSDAEVIRMFEEQAANEPEMSDDDATAMQKQMDAMTKGLTGASMQDMDDMSDEEIDRLEQETLEKYKK